MAARQPTSAWNRMRLPDLSTRKGDVVPILSPLCSGFWRCRLVGAASEEGRSSTNSARPAADVTASPAMPSSSASQQTDIPGGDSPLAGRSEFNWLTQNGGSKLSRASSSDRGAFLSRPGYRGPSFPMSSSDLDGPA